MINTVGKDEVLPRAKAIIVSSSTVHVMKCNEIF